MFGLLFENNRLINSSSICDHAMQAFVITTSLNNSTTIVIRHFLEVFSKVHRESRVEKVIFSCTWLCVFPVLYFIFTFSNLQPQQPRSRYAWFVCLASFATLQMTQFSIAAMDCVSVEKSWKSKLMVVYIENAWF